MRPRSIVNFERIVLLTIVLGIVNTILIWDRLSAAVAASGLGGGAVIAIQAVTIALYLLLIWFVSRKGSVVARWIYVVLAAVGLVYGVTGLGQVMEVHGTLSLVIAIVQYGLALVSIWLLFRPDSNAWFRGERPGLPGPLRTVGSSNGVRGGYCSRRMTASSASSVAGAASLMIGFCPLRM